MNDSDFWTLTELGQNYFGVSRNEVGKTLKLAKLRTADGEPTPTAIELGLTRKCEGPQPWIPVWKWHKKKTLPYLKLHGLEVIESPESGQKKEVAAQAKTQEQLDEEREVAIETMNYLGSHDFHLSWAFDPSDPPSQAVKDFLAKWAGTLAMERVDVAFCQALRAAEGDDEDDEAERGLDGGDRGGGEAV